jgi:hypothetical protein
MDKKKLLSEELKRHQQLLEYSFYVPEETKEKDDADLLFDGILNEQDPVGDEEVEDPFAVDVAVDTDETPEGEETDVTVEDPLTVGDEAGDLETDPFAVGDETIEVEDEFADESMGGEETVEVDVTDIVDKTEETKSSVDGLSTKMDDLLGKLSELESQVGGMDQVIGKIDELEKEIEKRNPTPVERLEMRSMDSFPYSVKLTDFWADKEGYDASEPETEYTLNQSDVDNYDEKEIRKSFNSDNVEENS